MNDSMAQPGHSVVSLELPGWKTALSWAGAIAISLLFLVSGVWKITDAPNAAVRMAQARVPEWASLPAAIGFGIAETVAGVLILVPRFRRWGAWLAGAMLVAFLVFIGINYNVLRGEECNCFPWIKRAVGPGFFIGDVIMLALAIFAGVWAKPSTSRRSAFVILAAVSVFALVSYGVAATRQTGTRAPETVTVDGRPYSLQQGKIFIYFFDPECLHCLEAAQRMARYNWGETKVMVAAIQNPRLTQTFLQDSGLRALVTTDAEKLRKTFPVPGVPAAVALENGVQVKAVTQFEGEQPGPVLRELGFIQ